jgi:hypothetical protein
MGLLCARVSFCRELPVESQGQQERGARPVLVAPDVLAWLARVRGLRQGADHGN